MEGIEIVITPRIIERAVFSIIIITLLVLLLVQCSNNNCDVEKKTEEKTESETIKTNPSVTNTASVKNSTSNSSVVSDSCSNGIKDVSETDIDCGGSCSGCNEYSMCNVDKDCAKGMYCFQHIKCMKPTCDDGIKNQDETNVDCGGSCSSSKGSYFWSSDQKCHSTKEPSGKLDITLSAKTTKSELSGAAILETMTIGVDNGLSKTVFLKATVFALTSNGKSVFPDKEGVNIAITSAELDSIASGGKTSKVIDFSESTRKVLAGVDADSKYQLKVEFRDGENNLVETKTWTHP
jgi:hypothetical protein